MRQINGTGCAIVIALSAIAFASQALAKEAGKPCDSDFRIYYGNGIRNTSVDWNASREELRAAIGDSYHGVPVTYANAFNPTHGLIDDVARVFQQKLAENPSLSWELLVRVFFGFTGGIDEPVVKAIRDIIAEAEGKSTADIKKQFEANNHYVDQNVVNHVTAYSDDILNHDRRVLVVGHSQGTLYANASYKLLYANAAIQSRSFGVSAVASVANYVAGDGPYLTSDRDAVAGALRAIVAPDTLRANISLPFNGNDILGHSFLFTYMRPDFASRSVIVEQARGVLDSLDEPHSYGYGCARRWAARASSGEPAHVPGSLVR